MITNTDRLRAALVDMLDAYDILMQTDGAASLFPSDSGGNYTVGHWMGSRMSGPAIEAREALAAADAGHVAPSPGNPVRCSLCRSTVPSVDSAIAAGWIPSYYDGEDQCPEPACPACVSRRLRVGADGEHEVRYPETNEAY